MQHGQMADVATFVLLLQYQRWWSLGGVLGPLETCESIMEDTTHTHTHTHTHAHTHTHTHIFKSNLILVMNQSRYGSGR